MAEITDILTQIMIKLDVAEEKQRFLEDRITRLDNVIPKIQNQNIQTEIEEPITNLRDVDFQDDIQRQENNEDEDIETDIKSGDEIQLESYKSIPGFSGVRGTYRPWRNQVVRRMKMIDAFRRHPKYEAALAIIRAKITGHASNVLTNFKTAYNIVAIIRRLDSSFADQRPLYVAEAEMTSIRQLDKTLLEFHDAINEALHMVISKIVHAYPTEAEQRSLVAEAQIKAVRTFTVGLKSSMMRHILYGRTPGTLQEAFAIAQTVYYDHLYTEQCGRINQVRPQQKQNMNYNGPLQKPNKQTINTNEYKRNNWRKPQQPDAKQKINQLQEDEPMNYDEQICEEIPDDLISNATNESNETDTASTFLSA